MPSRPPPSDEFDFDDKTVVDGEYDTPVEAPRCVECGGVVFVDTAGDVSYPDDRCIRALDAHFHWCHRLEKAVFYPNRKR